MSLPEEEVANVDQSTVRPPHPQRTLSHGSQQWSATETPSHHQIGTSYFTGPTSTAPRHPQPIRRTSSRRETRSTSISSSRATARGVGDLNSEILSEEDEEEVEEESNGNNHGRGKAIAVDDDTLGEGDFGSERDDDPITLKDRQSLINVEHPFGLPIWKPALYKKSRSVTRYADEALHSIPSAQAERHLLPGNIFWIVFFGWWLALSCFTVSVMLFLVPAGGKRYSSLVFGLGWYVAWPFGKYVEGDVQDPFSSARDEVLGGRRIIHEGPGGHDLLGSSADTQPDHTHAANPSQGVPLSQHSTITPNTFHAQHPQSESWNPIPISEETTSLLVDAGDGTSRGLPVGLSKFYGATPLPPLRSYPKTNGAFEHTSDDWLGRSFFWLAFAVVIAPLMLIVCIACWGLVVTIPMAKLIWALLGHMFAHPTAIRFCAAPPAVVVSSAPSENNSAASADPSSLQFSVNHLRLSAGQA